jgi:hypothetical protein
VSTQTLLTSGISATAGTSHVTASISPTANRLIVLDVISDYNAGSAPDPSASGAGMTWTKVLSISDSAAGINLCRFRAMSASPGSGAITISNATSSPGRGWAITEVSDVDTSGTNGANAIVQTVSNFNDTGSVNTVTATLAAFSSADNGALAVHGFFNAAPVRAATPDTGWTETSENTMLFSGNVFALGIETQWRADNDTTALATWAGNGAVYAIASEIKAAAAGTSDSLTGVSATAGTGTVKSTISQTLTGTGLTASTGTVKTAPSYAITGNVASAATGAVAPTISIALTGNAATASVGSVSSSSSTTAALTGNAATSATGSVGASVSYALTGVSATTAVGTVSLPSSDSEALSGVAGTADTGDVGASVSYALTGVSATSAVGAVAQTVEQALTGVVGTAAPGTVTNAGGAVAISLTGVSAATAVGSVGTDVSSSLTGVSGAAFLRSLTAYQDYTIPDPEINRNGLRQRLPHISTKVLQADGTMHPDWYRALTYIQDVRLGGVDGPTLAALLTSISLTQAQAAAIAEVADQLLQQ